MQVEVFEMSDVDLIPLGTCEIRSLSGPSIEVLQVFQGRNQRQTPEAHPFRVIELGSSGDKRQGLVRQGEADPRVLPGWRAAAAAAAA